MKGTLSMSDFEKFSDNIYEAIVILGKRARQINNEQKIFILLKPDDPMNLHCCDLVGTAVKIRTNDFFCFFFQGINLSSSMGTGRQKKESQGSKYEDLDCFHTQISPPSLRNPEP